MPLADTLTAPAVPRQPRRSAPNRPSAAGSPSRIADSEISPVSAPIPLDRKPACWQACARPLSAHRISLPRRPTLGKITGGNVTRPRAADDFATIHARLVELRREREKASKQDVPGEDSPGRGERNLLDAPESRQRLEKNGWLTVATGRRYGPGRTR
jgi:hypothetical protein